MQSKILKVFYGADNLPYKDKERSVHFPIVGNAITGANNTTEIHFYVDRIGGTIDTTWVAVTKLPNGKIGNKVLGEIVLDQELNEYYVVLSLSSFYTSVKGDIYISLNGYQGGVNFELVDEIYQISGTPTIQATGAIKIAINYAPQMIPSTHFCEDDLAQILGLFSQYLRIDNSIVVINSISADISGFEDGQLFYILTEKQYYNKDDNSLVAAEDGNGILGSKRTLVRYILEFGDVSIEETYNMVGDRIAILYDVISGEEYLVKFQSNTGNSVRLIDVNSLNTWYATSTQLEFSNHLDDLIDNDYKDTLLHLNNYKDFAVPYDGATDDVDLGVNTLYFGSLHGIREIDDDLHIFTGNGNIVLSPDDKAYYGGTTNDEEIATHGWTNDTLSSAIESVKANAFIVVDTTTYPTLNSFLASTGEEGYIYLYPSTIQAEGYLQYIWENNEWLSIGTTQLDLTNYYNKSQTDALLNTKANDNAVVKLSGNQSISGVKTFSDSPIVPTPTSDNQAATKAYADTKVAQSSEHNKVYGTDNSGNQKLFDVDNTVGADGNIVRRASGTSQIMVPLTPTANGHASSKKYVDDSISSAISNVYKYKGTKTVAEINALTGQVIGDVYNVSDAGTLTDGNVQVIAGDNVAWTGSVWDKLANDIDWTAYDEKFIAAGFFEVNNYNESTGEITFVYSSELYIMSYDQDTGVMTIEAN